MSDNKLLSPSKDVHKNPKGKIVGSGQRLMAYNIYLKRKKEGLSKTGAVKHAAEDVGISVNLMFKIVGEMERTGELKSPKKNRHRDDFYSKLTEEEKEAVRRTVQSFFKKTEMPTLDKLLQATKQNESISPMSRSTLFKVLKKLGFVWGKKAGSCYLLPKRDLTERLPCENEDLEG